MGVEFAGFGLDGRSIKGGVSLPAQRLGRVALIAISVELSPYGWPAALVPLCQVSAPTKPTTRSITTHSTSISWVATSPTHSSPGLLTSQRGS